METHVAENIYPSRHACYRLFRGYAAAAPKILSCVLDVDAAVR